MSFDSEFDYTGSITFIDEQTDTLNVQVSSIVTQLADLANIDSSFDYLVTPKTTNLNRTKTNFELQITQFQELKGEVQTVTNLSANDKANLYSFYNTSVAETKRQWMGRMIYNTPGLIVDAGNVMSGNLSSAESNLLAELVCQKYRIDSMVFRINRQF